MNLPVPNTPASHHFAVRWLALAVGILCLPGCFGPAHTDGIPHNSKLNIEMILADEIRLDIISVDGQPIPEAPLRRALDRLSPHISGQFEVSEPIQFELPERFNGVMPQAKLSPPNTEASPTRVVLIFAQRIEGDTRGVFLRMDDGWQQILYSSERISDASSVFFPEDQFWEFVIFHELGHALGVPQLANHRWSAGHCTHPDCAMYPKVDLRSVTTYVLRGGPPMELCRRCTAELQAVREKN